MRHELEKCINYAHSSGSVSVVRAICELAHSVDMLRAEVKYRNEGRSSFIEDNNVRSEEDEANIRKLYHIVKGCKTTLTKDEVDSIIQELNLSEIDYSELIRKLYSIKSEEENKDVCN